MTREQFADLMRPVVRYYRFEFTSDDLEFYFKEVGHLKPRDLEKTLANHMRTYSSFPKIAHLLPKSDGIKTAKKRPHEHPEFAKHRELGDRMLEAAFSGQTYRHGETTVIALEPLVSKALDVYRTEEPEYQYDSEYLTNRVRESKSYSALHHLMLKEFAGLV